MVDRKDNGISILLGLKGYNIGEIWEERDRVIVEVGIKGRQKCPYCGPGRLYRHGRCKPREVLHSWSKGRKVYLKLKRGRWKCRDCDALLPRAGS